MGGGVGNKHRDRSKLTISMGISSPKYLSVLGYYFIMAVFFTFSPKISV